MSTLCCLEQETCPKEYALSGIMYLPDDQISASGSQEGYEPRQGRLESTTGWIADSPHSVGAFIQVRFDRFVDLVIVYIHQSVCSVYVVFKLLHQQELLVYRVIFINIR